MPTVRLGNVARFLSVTVGALLASTAPLLAQMGVFGGIAGRSTPNISSGTGDTLGFRPFVGASGTYIRNLSDYRSVTSRNDFWALTTYGGVSGAKVWSRSGLGITYRGAGRFSRRQGFNAVQNHVLALGYSHLLSPRVSVSTSLLGGLTTGGLGYGSVIGGIGGFGNVGGFSAVPGAIGANPINDQFGDPEFNELVDDEVSDTWTKFAASTGGISYRMSERVTLSGGAAGFIVRREGRQFGMQGYNLRGVASYALGARSTIGGYYTFSDIDYYRAYNTAQIHTTGLFYRTMPIPHVTISVYGGAYRWHSNFVGTVTLDPLLAELLGTTIGQEIRETTRYSYIAGLTVMRDFRNSSLSFMMRRGIFPGNGALIGGQRTVAALNYSYSGIDRWHWSTSARWSNSSGITQPISVSNYFFRASTSYRFWSELHWRVGFGYRILSRPGPDLHQLVASAGIAWSPGETPLPY